MDYKLYHCNKHNFGTVVIITQKLKCHYSISLNLTLQHPYTLSDIILTFFRKREIFFTSVSASFGLGMFSLASVT